MDPENDLSASDSPPKRTTDDVARRLAERNLPTGRGGVIVWTWILALPVLLAATLLLRSDEPLWFYAFLFFALTSWTIARISASACHFRAALLLAELDVEWLGPLIDALAYPNGALREIARLRLITILPRLPRTLAESLTPGRKAMLFDHLTPWKAYRDPDLTAAITALAGRLADDRSLAGLDRLAGMRAFTDAQRRIRQLARGLLPSAEQQLYTENLARTNADGALETRPAGESRLSEEARSWLAEVETDSRGRPAMRFGFLVASWGVMLPFALFHAITQWGQGSKLIAVLALLGGLLATQLYRLAMTPAQLKLAAKLGSVDNVEAVGSLAELTVWPDERIRSMAVGALTRILPRMKSSDSHLLSEEQRKCLYSWLDLRHSTRYAEFQEALLTALEQVGDLEAIPLVTALASRNPGTVRETRVVESATACLPFLEGSAQFNRNSRTLLRAAGNDSAELLHPAAAVEIPAELLVRPANPTNPPY